MFLPDAYIDVPSAILLNKGMRVPPSVIPVRSHETTLPVALAEENVWRGEVKILLCKDKLDENDHVSWAAFHASHQQQVPPVVTLNALIPLFYENTDTVAMCQT